MWPGTEMRIVLRPAMSRSPSGRCIKGLQEDEGSGKGVEGMMVEERIWGDTAIANAL